jgi:hypothetical protein
VKTRGRKNENHSLAINSLKVVLDRQRILTLVI